MAPARGQRGMAALLLVALVALLALAPALLLQQSAIERQRVLDAQVRAMLKGTSKTAPRPASAPSAPIAPVAPQGGG